MNPELFAAVQLYRSASTQLEGLLVQLQNGVSPNVVVDMQAEVDAAMSLCSDTLAALGVAFNGEPDPEPEGE